LRRGGGELVIKSARWLQTSIIPLTLVSSEQDVWALQKLCAEHIGKSMVFLKKGENGTVGSTFKDELVGYLRDSN
jgi:hypothetical protein